jgi:5-oxoprolinase (ATP-hydrolysing) subunit A
MPAVDLNCDMGESFGAYHIGADAAVMPFITSANIACGFHGGDPGVMRETVALAKQHGVAVGAHPGLPDLVGFGRRNMDMSATEVYDAVVYQIGALAATAAALGVTLQHVKAHGALYHMGGASRDVAQAIARAVRDVDPHLVFFALPGSHMVVEGEAAGLKVASEAFADRNYMPDATLVSRKRPDAHVDKAEDVGKRAIRMVREGRVRAVDGKDVAIRADTICIHGDGPHAADFARRLREAFTQDGVSIQAVGRAAAK